MNPKHDGKCWFSINYNVLTMDARFLSLRSFVFLSSLSLRSYAGLYNKKMKTTLNGTNFLGDVIQTEKIALRRSEVEKFKKSNVKKCHMSKDASVPCILPPIPLTHNVAYIPAHLSLNPFIRDLMLRYQEN